MEEIKKGTEARSRNKKKKKKETEEEEKEERKCVSSERGIKS